METEKYKNILCIGDDKYIDTEQFLAKSNPKKTIAEHSNDLLRRALILYQLGYIKDKELYNTLCIACVLHDVGKINREMQKRLEYAVENEGRKLNFCEDKEIPHNILSMFLVEKNPKDNLEDLNDYYRMLYIVGFHHDYADVFEILQDKEKKVLIDNLLNQWNIKSSKITMKDIRLLKRHINSGNRESIFLKGLLQKCDYSASASCEIEYPNDFLLKSLDKLLEKWQQETETEKIEWNKLQKFCIQNRDENIIAIAQTGMGKTEAVLHWIGDNKGFFVLPLRTAINAMYNRIKNEILGEEGINHKLAVLHSESLNYYLNERGISENSLLDFNKKGNEEQDIIEHEKQGKRLSIPLTISTMDQIFDFVFKYQGFELKLATLSYSKVVIDEIQMYSADILAYLIRGLEMINELGGKIAVVTATLPPFVEDLLNNKIKFKKEVFVNDLKRHNVRLLQEKINCKKIFEVFNKNKNEGKANKVLVVCNSINKAQEIYDDLISKLGKEVHILHAKFTKEERAEKEYKILKTGRTYNTNGDLDIISEIWVSTSLVEASLDIDFDYLFTELSDINSLFQRMGRCNRKGKKNCDFINCYVYTEIDSKLIKNGDKGFIDKKIYEQSKDALLNSEFEGIVSEQQKIDLLNDYFKTKDMKEPVESVYLIEYREIYNYLGNLSLFETDRKSIDLRNILSVDVIPGIIYEKNLDYINKIVLDLSNKELTYIERVRLEQKVKNFVVSVPAYIYTNYNKAVYNKKAIKYPVIVINNYNKIPVIECIYNDKGFVAMDYNNDIRETLML